MSKELDPKEWRPVCITVPERFKWVARQYSGEWVVFTHKPRIGSTGDFFDEEETKPIEFWECPDFTDADETYLTDNNVESVLVPNWKETLRFIG